MDESLSVGNSGVDILGDYHLWNLFLVRVRPCLEYPQIKATFTPSQTMLCPPREDAFC